MQYFKVNIVVLFYISNSFRFDSMGFGSHREALSEFGSRSVSFGQDWSFRVGTRTIQVGYEPGRTEPFSNRI